jgi:RNA polymerase sigma-70 factor (ECF subfamily)
MAFDVEPTLLRNAAAGDRAAFQAMAEGLTDEISNLSWRMTFNRADAEDLAQEFFMMLYRNLRRYDDKLPFAPWARRVFTNLALNFRRRLRPQRALPEQAADPKAEPPGDETEIVEAALKTLPQEYRLVVAYKYYQDLQVEEIARLLHVPEGTVKTWLFRAREALRAKLEKAFA